MSKRCVQKFNWQDRKGKRHISPITGPRCPEVSRKLWFPDYVTTAQNGDNVVSLTHRPLFTPRKNSWYSFLLEAESAPRPQCDGKYYVNKKFQLHHLESNQRPSETENLQTIILPLVLYGCETWSLTLREERRLIVSENRVLRIFGPKRDEVTGEWRKLHNEELNDLYCSPTS